jgi:hypothetical protein
MTATAGRWAGPHPLIGPPMRRVIVLLAALVTSVSLAAGAPWQR